MTGQDLKEWRRKWGLSQEDLGRALGVYRVTITRWETGTRAIPSFLPLALEALEHRAILFPVKGIGGDMGEKRKPKCKREGELIPVPYRRAAPDVAYVPPVCPQCYEQYEELSFEEYQALPENGKVMYPWENNKFFRHPLFEG